MELAQCEAARARCGGRLIRRSPGRYRSAGRLWQLSCNPHGAPSADQPAASSHQQAFLFSLSRNATRFNQDDQQRPAMPERPLRATPSVGPLSSKCPTSRASEYSGCSAAAHPCLFDAAFKFAAATTSLRRSIHIDSDPCRSLNRPTTRPCS